MMDGKYYCWWKILRLERMVIGIQTLGDGGKILPLGRPSNFKYYMIFVHRSMPPLLASLPSSQAACCYVECFLLFVCDVCYVCAFCVVVHIYMSFVLCDNWEQGRKFVFNLSRGMVYMLRSSFFWSVYSFQDYLFRMIYFNVHLERL